jgi:hypothetical protein
VEPPDEAERSVVPWSARTDVERTPWPGSDAPPPYETRGWQDLDMSVEVPASATAGDTLRYVVTLANRGDDAIDLRPCGGFTQLLTSSTAETLEWHGVGDLRRLNCDDAPTLEAGASRSYEMRLEIPADAPTVAEAQLFWALLDGRTDARATLAIAGDDAWTPPAPPPEETLAPSEEAPTDADRALIDDFISFATDSTTRTAAAVPWAATIDVGLGPVVLSEVRATEVADSGAWTIPIAHHQAWTGPFNPLWQLEFHPAAGYDVSVGAHPHCANPPRLPPVGYAEHRRVSLQPTADSYTSCLEWFTIDLFLDDAGDVAAVTLDLYEP